VRPTFAAIAILAAGFLLWSPPARAQADPASQPKDALPEDSLLQSARDLELDGDWDEAREKYEQALEAMTARAAPPRELADLRHEFADRLVEWSNQAEAVVHFEQAIELLRQADASFEEVAGLRIEAAQAQVHVDEDAAEDEYRDVLGQVEDRLGVEHPLRAEARLSLGALFARQSWLEGAQEQFNIAFEPLQSEQRDSEELIALLQDAADQWFWVDENTRALRLREEAIEMRARLSGEDSPAYIQALSEEADWLAEWGYDEKAAAIYSRLVERYEDDPTIDAETLADAYAGLGSVNWETSGAAEGALRAAVSIRRQANLRTLEQVADLREVADWVNYLIYPEFDIWNDYDDRDGELDREGAQEVVALLQEALSIARDLGQDGLETAHGVVGELVDVLVAMGRTEAAEDELRRQIAVEEDAGDALPRGLRAGLWERLGDLYLEQEDPDAVEAYGWMLALREEDVDDETGLQSSIETLRDACERLGFDDRVAALNPRLNRIAWKNLVEEYDWLAPLGSSKGLTEALSPTGFFGGVFLLVGLVVAGAGGRASIRIARASDRRAREESPEPEAPAVVAGDALSTDKAVPTYKARFHGDGRELFGIFVVNSLWSILTLSIYYFWGKVRIRRYVWSHAEFAGDRFAFHGTPMELFVGWLKGSPVVAAVIWGPMIVLMYTQSSEAENWATAAVFGLVALLWPIAEIGAHRYRMSRTSWRAIRFSFQGKTWRYALIYLFNWPVWLFTLGLWTPFFNAIKRRYLMNHMHFGDSRFACDASGRDLFKAYLVNWLLFIPTLGMYSFWYLAYRERYYWSRTTYRGARFRSTITGSQLFELTAVAGLLMLITLGLAWPWVRTWRMKVWLESIELDGTLDLQEIRQDPQAVDATGEGVADFLGVDFGFFE